MSARYVLAIDQGTTSTRAMLFDDRSADHAPLRRCRSRRSTRQRARSSTTRRRSGDRCSKPGRAVLAEVRSDAVVAIGITNQRETTVAWERATGKLLANAIVWQDRRTAPLCADLTREGDGAHVTEVTGLIIDPYFSATKLAWLLRHVPGLEARALAGEVCFGTVDSFLLFKLTGGRLHATDATNAARTMLYDIRSGRWDERLLYGFACRAPCCRKCATARPITA